jgi:fumarate reductase subunit C
MVREFTALPLALWLLWFLYEIQRAGRGASGFYPPSSTPFVIFSVICLLFALYHSVTFLSLAGVILHFKVMDRPVPSRLVVASQFGIWLVASIVIGAVLIGFGR